MVDKWPQTRPSRRLGSASEVLYTCPCQLLLLPLNRLLGRESVRPSYKRSSPVPLRAVIAPVQVRGRSKHPNTIGELNLEQGRNLRSQLVQLVEGLAVPSQRLTVARGDSMEPTGWRADLPNVCHVTTIAWMQAVPLSAATPTVDLDGVPYVAAAPYVFLDPTTRGSGRPARSPSGVRARDHFRPLPRGTVRPGSPAQGRPAAHDCKWP